MKVLKIKHQVHAEVVCKLKDWLEVAEQGGLTELVLIGKEPDGSYIHEATATSNSQAMGAQMIVTALRRLGFDTVR